MRDRWSATRLRTWHRCARLHHYRYDLDCGEPTTDVAAFGHVGHSHLESGLRVRLGETAEPLPMLPDMFEHVRLQAVLDGYHERWGGDPQWEILGVEVPFEFTLADHLIVGRMDGIVQNKSDGRVLVLEHKFTSSDASPGSSYWDKLTLDVQVSAYVDGAKMLGYDVAGVVFDVIAKPAHKVKRATPVEQRKYTKATAKAESKLYAGQREEDETPAEFYNRIISDIAERPDDFYSRATVVRTEDELPKMRADILDTIKLARIAEMFDVHPRNSDACHKFGSRCFFWDACVGAADINDVIRFPRRARDEQSAPVTP